MPSSITAVLNSPYITPWQVTVPQNAVGNPLSVVNNIATVGTHSFSTGDKIYTCNRGLHNDTNSPFGALWYAIKISNTELAFATSYTNAINNVRTGSALTSSDSSIAPTGMTIANVPVIFNDAIVPVVTSSAGIITFFNPSFWVSSAKSLQSFNVTDNVQIDFTVPNNITQTTSIMCQTHNCFGLEGQNNYSCGFLRAFSLLRGDSISGTTPFTGSTTSWTNAYRFLIQNQRITIQNKQTNGSYLTIFTSSVLSLNISGLRLFSNFSLNGQALTNCQITYF